MEPKTRGRLERDAAADGGFRFFDPNGREVATAGVPLVPPPYPIDALHAQHQARGITIDATTNAIRWDGRPPDYAHAVWSLMAQPEVLLTAP